MPQVDPESLVCVSSGDPKVGRDPQPDPHPHHHTDPYPDPDLPAESYTIPISGNLDWLDINPVYDRDDSTKGTTNPKSHHHQPPPPSNSQRFGGNLKAAAKAPTIGLPNKFQHSGYLGQSARRPSVRIIPQKGVRLSDPGSPKVSCFGKVLSGRERNRRRGSPATAVGGGCCGRLFMCFERQEEAVVEGVGDLRPESNVPARQNKASAAEAEPLGLGLGGMKRFVSGRRASSWGGDVEVDLDGKEHGRVVWSGPLDRQ